MSYQECKKCHVRYKKNQLRDGVCEACHQNERELHNLATFGEFMKGTKP